LLITSADASQHSALVDVMKRKNMAIKGPPGTGKSQTITNIIANALAKGKSVLFLAEKMAALNVVYERLSKANLGPYCLELHSTKAKKTEILKSIEERLKLRPLQCNAHSVASKVQDFKRHKDHITEYINILNDIFGRQNKPIHDYLWGTQLRKDRIGDLHTTISQCKIPFEQANLSVSELSAYTDELETMASLKKQVDKESQNTAHPWSFVNNSDLNPFQQDELKILIEKWKKGSETIQRDLEVFNQTFNLSLGTTLQHIKTFYDSVYHLINEDITSLNESFIAELEHKEKASAVVNFVERIQIYRSCLKKVHAIKDVSSAMDHIKEIEGYTLAAKEIDVENMTSSGIEDRIKKVQEELSLWDANLKTLLTMGERFGVSKNDDLKKIYALAEVPHYIASVPRYHLLFRTNDIIDETNAPYLKSAADTQERIQESLKAQEESYNLSMMGAPHEIRLHAAELENAGFFSIFYSSYRQAKNLIKRASRGKIKFDRKKSSNMLYAIADNKEEKEKIEKDTRLQRICGTSFNGIQTDFRMLQKINEWASHVRKFYGSGDEFSKNVRYWLLKGDMEEMDSMREFANEDHFVALKRKIADMKHTFAPSTPLKEYLDSLIEKAEKLKMLKDQLQNIASNETITFSNLKEDLFYLKKAKDAYDNKNQDPIVKNFFAHLYKGSDTDIQDIEKTACFIGKCLSIPDLEKGFDVFLNNDFSKTWKNFKIFLEELSNTIHNIMPIAEEADGLGHIQVESFLNKNHWHNIDLSNLIKELSQALRKADTLNQWIRFKRHYARTCDSLMGELLETYNRESLDFQTLPSAFEYMVYSALSREIYQRNPVILKTTGMSLQQARVRIKELDQEIMELQKKELCRHLNLEKPLSGIGTGRKKTWTERDLIHNEITKQRCHISIRELMKRAGQSIQKIKPCFLMSPLTVAQYLDPEKLKFDLVVIDEASQMRPEDALGSIARAGQIVVVGDPKQLPPTSFFQSAAKDNDIIEEDFTSEAIMDMALSSFRPSRILSRHYRSQHESLIAFSNYHFYDKSLILFPSPIKNPDELGVKLYHVGGTYAANSNIQEVDAIVKAALDFMRKYPERSLGIATMNQVQKDMIDIEMDRAFIEHSHAANYKAKWQGTLESFFVKNLESVQGDERDAIFISTVYGPDKNGTVMQRFGPINLSGGYKRLNVLFSRAKKNMVVFTSLNPEDIKISDTSSEGIRALRGFLAYAIKGVIDEGQRDRHEIPDSDFEIWVKEKLESIGCEVHPQVGVAGYRIDLGVKHPKYPYGYLMGIECDGATYHSSKSARERDVIRQQVLEGLGWHIYRIWSTDWFSNPSKEFEKLKNHIQGLLN
jgi:very-short-patch-repair endonuclease/RecA/RadA recombinase